MFVDQVACEIVLALALAYSLKCMHLNRDILMLRHDMFFKRIWNTFKIHFTQNRIRKKSSDQMTWLFISTNYHDGRRYGHEVKQNKIKIYISSFKWISSLNSNTFFLFDNKENILFLPLVHCYWQVPHMNYDYAWLSRACISLWMMDKWYEFHINFGKKQRSS